MKTLRQIKVVIASPSDTAQERSSLLNNIIQRLNNDIAENLGFNLRALAWEQDAYPGSDADGPQGLIDNVLKIEESDFFICILWKRAGTPVKDGLTGTEHEFKQAFESWKKSGKPHIMLYFNQKDILNSLDCSNEQLERVLEFKKNLPETILYWKYESLEQFKEIVFDHLTRNLQRLAKMSSQQLINPKNGLQFDIDSTDIIDRMNAQGGQESQLAPVLNYIGEKKLFIGREENLKVLLGLLSKPGSRASIVGPGGSGKSQLAFKTLRRLHQHDKIIDLVIPIYLHATSVTGMTFRNFLNNIAFCLVELGLLNLSKEKFNELDEDKAHRLIYESLSSQKHPILFCDNFEALSSTSYKNNESSNDVNRIVNFLNNHLPDNTSILITSRNRQNYLSEVPMYLTGLQPEEATDLFILHASAYADHLSNVGNVQIQALLHEIAIKTGGHPLSIEILAKSYEGGGTKELREISESLGSKRENSFEPEERFQTLQKCFEYSIEKLDPRAQALLPVLCIFNSPFPLSAVEEILGAEYKDIVNLYNKSFLSRIEEDQYGGLDDNFWLYYLHPATRNYLEYEYKTYIVDKLKIVVPNFCNYFNYMIRLILSSLGKSNYKNLIRQFQLITRNDNNDFERAIELAIDRSNDTENNRNEE